MPLNPKRWQRPPLIMSTSRVIKSFESFNGTLCQHWRCLRRRSGLCASKGTECFLQKVSIVLPHTAFGYLSPKKFATGRTNMNRLMSEKKGTVVLASKGAPLLTFTFVQRCPEVWWNFNRWVLEILSTISQKQSHRTQLQGQLSAWCGPLMTSAMCDVYLNTYVALPRAV